MSFLHLLNYPPQSGQKILQFRGSGLAKIIPTSSITHGGPSAQIIAACKEIDCEVTSSGSRILKDKEKFVEKFNSEKSKINELESNGSGELVSVYRLMPTRVELSVSGEVWDRFEWSFKEGGWGVERIVPY